MSRAKKTKVAKRRSAIGLYRQVGEWMNHAKKIEREAAEMKANLTPNQERKK